MSDGTDPPINVGDSVSIDVSGIYAGDCSLCGQPTLVVPGGVCVHCDAPWTFVEPRSDAA